MFKHHMKTAVWGRWSALCLAAILVTAMAGDCPMNGDPTGDPNPNGNSNTNTNGNGNGNTNTNGNDNSNGPNNSNSPAVKTQITLGSSGKIDIGDDLIVFGVGSDEAAVSSNQEAGVHYLHPSTATSATTAGTTIPNSASLFGTRDFVVAGKKVVLVRSTGAVSIYDTELESLTDISSTGVNVDPMVEANIPGQMRADGAYVATINNESVVGDGNVIKVIDTSGTTPTVITFPNPPDALSNPETTFEQVDIDAATMRVAAVSDNDIIYVFDIQAPNAAAVQIDLGIATDRGGFDGRSQIQFDNGYILYHQFPNIGDKLPGMGDNHAAIINVDTDTITVFDENPTTANTPLALKSDSYCYFLWRESADAGDENNSYRSAIGVMADAPGATLASQSDRYAFRSTTIDTSAGSTVIPIEDCLDQKLIGYGATCSVTPDGSRWFIAGWGPVHRNFDYVQMSTGGVFTDFADPEGDTLTGALMGSDIVTSNDAAAFRALRQDESSGCLTDDEWVLGFIVFDRL
ncbi:MAG: hypothetical protein H6819_00935 [Phycisphaerales bacterium]|nr:hypothetical protein [Phycisphaerales bacterium]MCB9857227.1 hypothetical protein [Phycisphaerales bacterium]MCB9863059.1 hypothetical protein [Phycisphaerales bacterium]